MPQFLRIFLDKFKEYIVLVILLVISLLLITLNEHQNVRNVRLFALGVFASVNSSLISLGSIFEDKEYISKLEKQNAELMLEVNKYREFGLANNELRGLLNLKDSTNYELKTAKIVSRLYSKVSGYFIISKGLKDSVNVGMPVVSSKGLVGIITDVTENYSTVRTLENTLLKIAVKDQRSNINGVLNWNGKELVIKNVPSTYDLELGDRIVVSELSSILPPSISVGFISKKETTISGVLTNLIITPFVNLKDLKYVSILLTPYENQMDSLISKLVENKN